MDKSCISISTILLICCWTQYVSSHYLPVLDRRSRGAPTVSHTHSANISSINWWQKGSSSQSIGFMCVNWPDLYDEFSSDKITAVPFTRNHFFADVPNLVRFLRVVIRKLLQAEVLELDAELIGDSIARVVARRLLKERATCSSSVLNTYLRVLLSKSFDGMLHQSNDSLKLHLQSALQKMGIHKTSITYNVDILLQRVVQYTSNDVSYYLERLEFAQMIPTFAALRARVIRILNIAEHSMHGIDINDATRQILDVILSMVNSGVLDCLNGQQLVSYYATYIDGMVRDFNTRFAVDSVMYYLATIPGSLYQSPVFNGILARFQTYFTTFVSLLQSVYTSFVRQSARDTVQLLAKYAGSFKQEQYMVNLMTQIFTSGNGTSGGGRLPPPPNPELFAIFKQILQEVDRQKHDLEVLLKLTASAHVNPVFISTLQSTLKSTMDMLNRTMHIDPAMWPWLQPFINIHTFTS